MQQKFNPKLQGLVMIEFKNMWHMLIRAYKSWEAPFTSYFLFEIDAILSFSRDVSCKDLPNF
jgi:hypothetical protein